MSPGGQVGERNKRASTGCSKKTSGRRGGWGGVGGDEESELCGREGGRKWERVLRHEEASEVREREMNQTAKAKRSRRCKEKEVL